MLVKKMLLKRKRQDLSICLSVFCWLIKSKKRNSEKIIAMCLSCPERELSFELSFRKEIGGMEGVTESSMYICFSSLYRIIE